MSLLLRMFLFLSFFVGTGLVRAQTSPVISPNVQLPLGQPSDSAEENKKSESQKVEKPTNDPREKKEDVENNKLAEWSCRVDSTPKEGGGFTVGEKFTLICEGTRVEFGQGEMHFQMPKELLYAIKILSVDKVSSNEVMMTVTTYMVAQAQIKGVVFVEDGVEKFSVKPFILTSKSVQKEKREKPFPPRVGAKMGYPSWLKYVFGLFLLIFIFGLLISLNRRSQRRGVLEKLQFHNSAIGGYNQYNKDLRSLVRGNVVSEHKPWSLEQSQSYLEKLDELFRMYLLREFVVPATDWKSSLVLKEIHKKDKKRFANYGSLLRQYLDELDRASGAKDRVTMADCQQLTQLGRKVSQKIWLTRKTGRSS